MKNHLKLKIKKLPAKPGVYLFKDASGGILYIGKAQNTQKRAKDHFTKPANFFSGQFIEMVADIDWIETDDEKQALLLEKQLIKKYHPRYNIQWQDDKSYFWVNFTDDDWPRVEVIHQNRLVNHSDPPIGGEESRANAGRHKVGGSPALRLMAESIIGPFVNGRELKQVLRTLRKIIPFRTCKNPYEKPCLQWHLGLCAAHNQGSKIKTRKTKIKNYMNSLNALAQFLRLYAGESIRIEAYDISNIQGNYATGSMIVFYGAQPSKSDYRRFRIKTVRGANDTAMIKEILQRRFRHQEWPNPDLVIIDGGRGQLNAVRRIANSLWQIANAKKSLLYAIGHTPYAVIALAKRDEEIYTEYSSRTIKISKLPRALRLIFQHARDEAHRFAVFYHRYLHEPEELRRIRKKRPKAH